MSEHLQKWNENAVHRTAAEKHAVDLLVDLLARVDLRAKVRDVCALMDQWQQCADTPTAGGWLADVVVQIVDAWVSTDCDEYNEASDHYFYAGASSEDWDDLATFAGWATAQHARRLLALPTQEKPGDWEPDEPTKGPEDVYDAADLASASEEERATMLAVNFEEAERRVAAEIMGEDLQRDDLDVLQYKGIAARIARKARVPAHRHQPRRAPGPLPGLLLGEGGVATEMQVPWADPYSDLPGTAGQYPVPEGIGPALTGEALLADPWIRRATAMLGPAVV